MNDIIKSLAMLDLPTSIVTTDGKVEVNETLTDIPSLAGIKKSTIIESNPTHNSMRSLISKISEPTDMLNESQLAELSRSTLKSYTKSAGQDVAADQRDASSARAQEIDDISHGNIKKGIEWGDEADWLSRRAEKRAGGIARATTKIAQKGVAEGLDPDTQRLEQEVRDALATGDDYTAKSLVKMAQTAADRNYLRKIIRQEMYGTGPGQGGVSEATDDKKFDSMMGSITKKKMAVDRKTGKEYDPEEEMSKLLGKHKSQFQGMAAIEKAQKKDVSESTSKQEMINSAETMTLDQFVSVYGEENEHIWHQENKEQGVSEAFENDESNLFYIYDRVSGRLKQRMVHNKEERQARNMGYKETHDEALKAAGIIRSKFDPKKFLRKQGDKWVQVFPYGDKNS